MINFSRIIKQWSVVLLLFLGFVHPANSADLVLGCLLLTYIVFVIWFNPIHKLHPVFLIAPMAIIFITTSYLNSNQLRSYLSHEPVSKTYRTDMDDFLKTYYVMKKDINYYSSFKNAVEQNAFKGRISANLWSWRLPTIFYFWQLLPGNGSSIYYAFIFLSIILLSTAFLIAKTLLNPARKHLAVLASYLIYPYLHFAARDTTFLQTEWWGLFPLFLGIYFSLQKKWKWSTGFFILTVLTRELFVIPLLITGVTLLVMKKKDWLIYILPVLIWFIFESVHAHLITQLVGESQNFLIPRLHSLGKQIITVTLAFGAWEYFFYRLRIFVIFFAFGLFGLLHHLQSEKLILLSFFIFPFSFILIGSSVYNDYWGVFYIPVVIISVPLIL